MTNEFQSKVIRWPLQASVPTRITISHSDIINAFLENVNRRGDIAKEMNLILKRLLSFFFFFFFWSSVSQVRLAWQGCGRGGSHTTNQSLRPQLGVLHFNSILSLSAQSWHYMPPVKGSIPRDCSPLQMPKEGVGPQVTHNFCLAWLTNQRFPPPPPQV